MSSVPSKSDGEEGEDEENVEGRDSPHEDIEPSHRSSPIPAVGRGKSFASVLTQSHGLFFKTSDSRSTSMLSQAQALPPLHPIV